MSEGGPSELSPEPDLELSIVSVAAAPQIDGALRLAIQTSRGEIPAVFHVCEGSTGAAVMVGGAMGGVDGPAKALYPRLGFALVEKGVSSLRLHYRLPGDFEECVLDVLAACSFLKGIGALSAVLVGHSFGGAVVIKAGEMAPLVRAVCAMSSQLYGTRQVENLGRPLLLVHGMQDQVLEAVASEDIYARAREPKRLVLYEGAGHSLDQAADELFELLSTWAIENAAGGLNTDA
jgi:pimeloyl-ACP methyl ester carboxylesterase